MALEGWTIGRLEELGFAALNSTYGLDKDSVFVTPAGASRVIALTLVVKHDWN